MAYRADAAEAAQREANRTSLRAQLRLIGGAVDLVWRASPARTLSTLVVQVLASGALFFQVILINEVLQVILEVGRAEASISQAVPPVGLLAFLTAATSAASTVANLQQRVLGELVARSIWRRILDVSQAVDLSAYEDPAYYDQADRVQGSAATQTQIVVQALVVLLGEGLSVLAGVVAVFTLAPTLLPLLLLSAVPLLITSRIAGRLEFAFAVRHSAQDRARSYLQAVLARREEAKEVRAFSLAPRLRCRWESNYSAFLTDLRRHVNRRSRLALVGNVGAATLTAGALLITLVLVDRELLDIASAGAALVAVRLLSARVGEAALGTSTVLESLWYLEELRSFLSRPMLEAQPPLPAPPDFDRMTVTDLTFTYPGAASPSLQGVSLDIRRGEVVALVGENGSGKSTLAKLLANLYQPKEGAILWDGVDLRKLDPDGVRRRIAVTFQDFVHYKFSARENISLGLADHEADDPTVRCAARRADADAFISALPFGYDTILSKEFAGGVDLSLGQWQRVALARAFVRDAPLVVLDEPSASLDARAEHDLFERIRTLFIGRTVLVISHRFSTVRTADRIYVLSEGKVLEQGDHASLMRQEGRYAELFRLQASAYLQ